MYEIIILVIQKVEKLGEKHLQFVLRQPVPKVALAEENDDGCGPPPDGALTAMALLMPKSCF